MSLPEAALVARLLADTTVAGLIGSKLFPDVPEEDTPLPAVMYQRTEAEPEQALTAATIPLTRFTFTFDVWATHAADAHNIADAIRASLDGYSGGNVQSCKWLGDRSEPDEYNYHVVATYAIWWVEAGSVAVGSGIPPILLTSTGPTWNGVPLIELPTQTGQSGKYLTTNGTAVSWGTVNAGVTSFNTRTGAVVPASGDYTAAQVTNAVDQTGSYANPSWITSLAETKVLPTQTSNSGKYLTTNGTSTSWGTVSIPVSSVFGRTGAVTAQTGDYTAAKVTNAVDQTGSYADPAWITSLAYSKLTGPPTIPTAANPTASIGLTAVNGSAATFMRSDGAPALSQSIAPTWTGVHTFTQPTTTTAGLVVKQITSSSSTSHLAEFQTSTGTVSSYVDSGGGININN